MAKANAWNTQQKVQNLTLSLTGPAVDVLPEISEQADDAYEQIWTALGRRFGYPDEEDTAIRKFDACRQQEGQSLAEFEINLRTYFREAWPDAEEIDKNSRLKRKFLSGWLTQN